MARIKKHQNKPRNQKTKHRRRKPNIPELVYKFLVANEAFDYTNSHIDICRYCDKKKSHDEVLDSSQIIDGSTSYKIRQEGLKNSGKISKLHNVKRCHVSRGLPISYLQRCVNDEDARKATRKYMKKALDFGVESGYLIPSDPAYKILRVSSDLMKSDSSLSRNKINEICNMALSKNRNISTRLNELQVQEQGKRQRRRRRSDRKSRRDSKMRRKSRSRSRSRSRIRRGRRSRSRGGGRRRYSPQNPEEVAEDESGDYEMDKNGSKSDIHTHDDIEREAKTVRSNQSDEERSTKKAEEDNSADLYH